MGPTGIIIEGQPPNEEAARYLAAEMDCFANTPGGGAIILGVADDGTRIGTRLDAEWLRHRIWEPANKQLLMGPHRDHKRRRLEGSEKRRPGDANTRTTARASTPYFP